MKKTFLSAALATTLSVGAASAATVEVGYQTPGNPFGAENLRQSIRIDYDPSPVDDRIVHAGRFQLTGNNGFGNFAAFCVDLLDLLVIPEEYEVPATIFSGTVLTNIDRLFTSAYDAIETAIDAAAFQVALWEIIYETETLGDLDAGDFSTSGNAAVEAAAEDLIANLGTETGGYTLIFLQSDDGQDLVTPTIPLPAAGLLLLGGLGGMAALRRKRKT